jgi:hypothetical protein
MTARTAAVEQGPGHSGVASGWSYRGESEGGQGPGAVPGLVPGGGGDVARSGEFQDGDGQSTGRVAIARGPSPVRIWEQSSP